MTVGSADVHERCGACGAEVQRGLELCPACGALLAAYRAPAAVDPSAAAPPAGPPDTALPSEPQPLPDIQPVDRPAMPGATAAGDPLLVEARQRLLRTLSAPRRDLLETIRRIESLGEPERAPEGPAPLYEVRKPVRMTPLARPARTTRRVGAPPPHRPGYLVRGTVEPLILFGLTLLLIACLLTALGSLLGGSAWRGIGLAMAALGIIAMIGAWLVVLARRDNERR